MAAQDERAGKQGKNDAGEWPEKRRGRNEKSRNRSECGEQKPHTTARDAW
jgi:hypothetical protein